MTIKQNGGIFGRNPSFNEVEADTASIVDLTITDEILFQGDSTGRIEQNKSSGRELLEIRSSSSGLAGGAGINVYGDGDSSFPDHVRIWGASEALRIDDSNNTGIYGNLIIKNSGNGIDFSATSDSSSGTATSELFDDYEEGTWTPTPLFFDGTPTVEGYYTKIGNMVFASFYIELDGTADGSNFTVYLPYAAYVVTNLMFGGALSFSTSIATGLTLRMENNVELRAYNSSGTRLNYNQVGNSSTISGTIIYRAA